MSASDPEQTPAGPPQRISPITFPSDQPALPKPGQDEPQQLRDAFREAGFALGPDIHWLLAALGRQRTIVEQSYGSSYRNRRYASALLFWSRVYAAGLDQLRLTTWASYSSVPPLLRASFEWLGAEQAVVGDEQEEFEDWLAAGYEHDADTSSTALGMGQYMAGQKIAGAEELAEAYRAICELARPHFGPAALLAAPESSRKKFAVHWGDRAFHLGWGQLLLGWQILVQGRQLRFAVGSGIFATSTEDREAYQQLQRQASTLLDARDRCRAEWVEQDGRQRLLIDNFRRQPSGAPKRFLL